MILCRQAVLAESSGCAPAGRGGDRCAAAARREHVWSDGGQVRDHERQPASVRPHTADLLEKVQRHHELVIDRFHALGFEDCLARFHGDYVQTFFRKNARAYQDDWIFSMGLSQQLQGCEALNSPDLRLL
jgi:hypothetical protein